MFFVFLKKNPGLRKLNMLRTQIATLTWGERSMFLVFL
jgi:hypothetical protein